MRLGCLRFHRLSRTGFFPREIMRFPLISSATLSWLRDQAIRRCIRLGMHLGADDWSTILSSLTHQLWKVGVRDVFADGSFAEDKDHPNDIDGYFVCDLDRLRTGELTRELNLLDPYKVWTWDPASRKPYRGYPKKQLPMWHRYRVELYPHFPGMGCGIRENTAMNLNFLLHFANPAAMVNHGA